MKHAASTLMGDKPMMTAGQFLRNFVIFTTGSVSIFIMGMGLGLAIVFINKYLPSEYISNNFVLILWSLYWGLSAYSLLFKPKNSQDRFELKMSIYTLIYGSGVYLVLLKGEGLTSANLFAGTAMLGLFMVITAPPFIEKYLKHKFIQRTR